MSSAEEVAKTKPKIVHLGEFKLKDHPDKQMLKITIHEPIVAVYIQKVVGSNNRFFISLERKIVNTNDTTNTGGSAEDRAVREESERVSKTG